MTKRSQHVHELVAKTAHDMCHVLYDTVMQDNEWYANWKKRYPGLSPKQLEGKFVAKNYGRMIGQARATLAGMLRGPLDSDLKNQIYEALCEDNSLVRGRGLRYVMPKELH